MDIEVRDVRSVIEMDEPRKVSGGLQGINPSLSLKAALERTEREIIAAALKANNNNRQALRLLRGVYAEQREVLAMTQKRTFRHCEEPSDEAISTLATSPQAGSYHRLTVIQASRYH